MITGFNTDVDFQGRVYHVQTEDRGLGNPTVESLIFCGGEIIASSVNSYSELVDTPNYSEEAVLARMEDQHQSMIRDILNGKHAAGGHKPFGYAIVTNRSLDEVVLDFLDANCSPDRIRLEMIDDHAFHEGSRPTVRIRVVDEERGQPVGGARVCLRLISTLGDPRELFNAPTDAEGFVEATFEIPELDGADSALLCEARAGGAKAELRQLVGKRKRQSA